MRETIPLESFLVIEWSAHLSETARILSESSMPGHETNVETWLERALLVAAWALCFWTLIRRFVPAHPIEQSTDTLLLAAALACVTTARSVAASLPRRVLKGIAVALVVATFGFL